MSVAQEVGLPSAPVSVGSRLTQNQWIQFVARRLVSMVAIFVVLLFLTFIMVRLVPGDAARTVGGMEASAETIDAIRARLGLDQPVHVQFIEYSRGLFTGEMGASFISRQAVSDLIGQRLAISARLAGFALAIVMALSVPLGMVAAVLTRNNRHRKFEAGFTSVTSVMGAFPEYLIATLFAAVFGVWFRILPVAGLGSWRHWLLPVAAIAIRPTATLARIVRLETLNALGQDYIRTAEAKRLPRMRIYVRHVLPNASTAALTIGGMLFAGLISGAVLVENIFALPGLGTALVDAVKNHDYPVVQGIVLFLGIAVVVVNTVVDIALAVVDPRSLAKEG